MIVICGNKNYWQQQKSFAANVSCVESKPLHEINSWRIFCCSIEWLLFIRYNPKPIKFLSQSDLKIKSKLRRMLRRKHSELNDKMQCFQCMQRALFSRPMRRMWICFFIGFCIDDCCKYSKLLPMPCMACVYCSSIASLLFSAFDFFIQHVILDFLLLFTSI